MIDPMAKKQNKSIFPATVRRFFRLLELTAVFLLGAVLTNLDRLGDLPLHIPSFREIRQQQQHSSVQEGHSRANDLLVGTVQSVYDGDTVTLLADGQKYSIRCYGIDAPEIKQEGGITARDRLRHKILNKTVQVEVVNVDRYGRSVGKIFLNNRYINLEMAAEGSVWYYEAYAKNARDLRDAAATARSRKRGIWRNPAPQPPWEFRK